MRLRLNKEIENFIIFREYEELNGSLLMVQDLVERQGIPVFSQMNHALNCTAKVSLHSLLVCGLSLKKCILLFVYFYLEFILFFERSVNESEKTFAKLNRCSWTLYNPIQFGIGI